MLFRRVSLSSGNDGSHALQRRFDANQGYESPTTQYVLSLVPPCFSLSLFSPVSFRTEESTEVNKRTRFHDIPWLHSRDETQQRREENKRSSSLMRRALVGGLIASQPPTRQSFVFAYAAQTLFRDARSSVNKVSAVRFVRSCTM